MKILGLSLIGPPPVGTVHLSWEEGLTVLYGKNGAGKSTILAGIEAAVRGIRSPKGGTAYLHLDLSGAPSRVSDSIAENIYYELAQTADGLSPRPDYDPGREFFDEIETVNATGNWDFNRMLEAWLKYVDRFDGFLFDRPPREITRQLAGECLVSLQAAGDEAPEWYAHASARPSEMPAFHAYIEEARREHESRLPPGSPSIHHHWGGYLELWNAIPPAALPLPVVRVVSTDAAAVSVVSGTTQDVDLATNSLIGRRFPDLLVGSGGFEGIYEVAEGVSQLVKDLEKDVNTFLASMPVDAPSIEGVFVQPGWGVEGPVQWQATLPNKEQLPDLDSLSAAQQRWVRFGIEFAVSRQETDGRPQVFIIDEPERALHHAAERTVAQRLVEVAQEQHAPIYTASHSAEFLNTIGAHLMHVQRDQNGWAVVNDMDRTFQGGLLSAVEGLGLRPSDVLQLVRVFLVVEGMRDVAITEALIGDDLNQARVMTLPMHGTSKLTSVLDSQLIFDFTDAPLVVAVDNLRLPLLRQAWEQALALAAEGRKQGAADVLWDLERGQQLTEEEEVVLQFCRRALESGKSAKVRIFGFEERDGIYYLPVDRFVPDAHSWDNVRKQYLTDREPREDIKPWLSRIYGANTSVRSFRKIAESMDSVPLEFKKLLDTCMDLAGKRLSTN